MSSSSTIPECLPLHPGASTYFHGLHTSDTTKYVDLCDKQFNETLDQIINSAAPNTEELIKSLTKTYAALNTERLTAKRLAGKLNTVKQEYKMKSDQCEQISLSNWDLYRTGEMTAPNLLKLYDDAKDSRINNTQTAEDGGVTTAYLLKIFPYIWENPTCVLPDLTKSGNAKKTRAADDDEIHIEGGNIELICPITCKPYERPLISKKCGHVFDHEGIVNYLRGHGSRDCPQGGCGKVVSMRDFVPDKIMSLRCKIDKIQKIKANKEDNENLDTL
ncbi:SUMO ligase MMS21 NDAI_0G00530 [Naumovozyma dairenensis CBS 421]|uniref:SP-RING-type domain-containing protein n=1 Tax=Naumovozyma dairenensis (strain ATCC 10597 / BCRC 20456 / CBS 421 / NBRC 0211 / NRRL Y-12639) TaxID=1071378 RepID=G0WDG8_NAUDC|nr:hypothetical protein NDAI_0G00530 [Naumovozyma dairenensis CBS 421]CCD25829.2 hypothetical protein NDAI_0G00530 [Naumovozyma dairenensis CBS 421]